MTPTRREGSENAAPRSTARLGGLVCEADRCAPLRREARLGDDAAVEQPSCRSDSPRASNSSRFTLSLSGWAAFIVCRSERSRARDHAHRQDRRPQPPWRGVLAAAVGEAERVPAGERASQRSIGDVVAWFVAVRRRAGAEGIGERRNSQKARGRHHFASSTSRRLHPKPRAIASPGDVSPIASFSTSPSSGHSVLRTQRRRGRGRGGRSRGSRRPRGAARRRGSSGRRAPRRTAARRASPVASSVALSGGRRSRRARLNRARLLARRAAAGMNRRCRRRRRHRRRRA